MQEFSSTGAYLSQFGSAGSGNGQFGFPEGVCFDLNGNLWVVDATTDRLRKFTGNGVYVGQFGSPGSGSGHFAGPFGIAIDIRAMCG